MALFAITWPGSPWDSVVPVGASITAVTCTLKRGGRRREQPDARDDQVGGVSPPRSGACRTLDESPPP